MELETKVNTSLLGWTNPVVLPNLSLLIFNICLISFWIISMEYRRVIYQMEVNSAKCFYSYWKFFWSIVLMRLWLISGLGRSTWREQLDPSRKGVIVDSGACLNSLELVLYCTSHYITEVSVAFSQGWREMLGGLGRKEKETLLEEWGTERGEECKEESDIQIMIPSSGCPLHSADQRQKHYLGFLQLLVCSCFVFIILFCTDFWKTWGRF